MHTLIGKRVVDHENHKENVLYSEADQLRQHRRDRHDEARIVDLAHRSGVRHESIGSRRQTAAEVLPQDRAAEIEHERRQPSRRQTGNVAENQREDNRRQKRLNERPRRAENGLLILRDKVALDEKTDQIAIVPNFLQIDVKPPVFRGNDGGEFLFFHSNLLLILIHNGFILTGFKTVP